MRRTGGGVLVSRTLKTVGVTEGGVDEMLGELLRSTNPSVGVYSRADGIQVRIAAKAAGREEAERLIAPVEAEARRLLGDAVWGVDDDTLEKAVGAMLRERGLTLATMESCTGGLLASTITDVPGSSDYFRGGLVSYATEVKIALGVSREVVERARRHQRGVRAGDGAGGPRAAGGGYRDRRYGRGGPRPAGGEAGGDGARRAGRREGVAAGGELRYAAESGGCEASGGDDGAVAAAPRPAGAGGRLTSEGLIDRCLAKYFFLRI